LALLSASGSMGPTPPFVAVCIASHALLVIMLRYPPRAICRRRVHQGILTSSTRR
jgi:hypothetical protein